MNADRVRAYRELLSDAIERDRAAPRYLQGQGVGRFARVVIEGQVAGCGAVACLFLHDELACDERRGTTGEELEARMRLAVRAGAKSLLLCVDSPGGDVEEGLRALAALEFFEGRVVAHVANRADSMATIVARGAEVVVAEPGATFLLHRTRGTAPTGELAAADERLNSLLVERSHLTAGAVRTLISARAGQGTRLTTEQAFGFGLVDQLGDVAAAWKVAAAMAVRHRPGISAGHHNNGVNTMQLNAQQRRRLAALDDRISKMNSTTEESAARVRAVALSPALETKLLGRPFAVSSATDTEGLIEGHAAVFDDEHPTSALALDSEWKDVIRPGAFAKSLAEHKSRGTQPPMLWMHDRGNIPGAWRTVVEDKAGLFVAGGIARSAVSPSGVPVYELLKMGAMNGLSIGFRVTKAALDEARRVRELLEVELAEISLVDIPGGPRARITDVKHAGR